MAISASIIPGKVFEEGEAVNISTLNLLGNPTVNIEGAVGTVGLEDDSVTNAKVNSAAAIATSKLALSSAIEVDGTNVGIGGTADTVAGYTAVAINNATHGGMLDFQVGGSRKGSIYTNGATDFRLGSISSIPLKLFTGTSVAMTIDTNQNVGIGTTAPSETLHTKQTGFYSTFLERDGGTTGTQGWLKIGMSALSGSGADALLDAKHSLGFRTNGSAGTPTIAMTIDDSQNVGIGGAASDSRLEIDAATSSASRIKLNYDGTPYCYFGGYNGIAGGTGNESDVGLYAWTGKFLSLGANATEAMRISADGKVAIANSSTSSPVASLELTGGSIVDGGGTGIFFKGSSSSTADRFGARINTIREAGGNGAVSLVFSTDDSSSLNEAMRITSDGHVILANVQEGDSGLASGTIYKDSGFLKIVA